MELLQKEGNRNVKRKIEFYNLDTIISVGFRVNTRQGILFRTWANNVLKKYLLKGYAVHDRYLIIDDEVWLLGASVKDMGRGLCTIIKLGFTPEEILKRI